MCVIRFRTLGAIISSNIFSAPFILSSPSETPVKYMFELPVVQHVPQALFLFSLHIFFSVFFRLDYISVDLYLQVYWLFPVILILLLSPSSRFLVQIFYFWVLYFPFDSFFIVSLFLLRIPIFPFIRSIFSLTSLGMIIITVQRHLSANSNIWDFGISPHSWEWIIKKFNILNNFGLYLSHYKCFMWKLWFLLYSSKECWIFDSTGQLIGLKLQTLSHRDLVKMQWQLKSPFSSFILTWVALSLPWYIWFRGQNEICS